ncbi:MAG TPA: menaquinone biosynthesis protein [Vicinamibacterales bacterium]|nr:menaquinone biosynthesis protein [Vicinamibacterales bacterium]
MSLVRLGAVGYLNARPLVFGLERRRDLFDVRLDVPSTCATLLHANEIDVGMIPSIEYQRGPVPYRIVPGVGIVSDGPVASVAVFARVPLDRVRRLALDTSSRTSAGLTQVLCREAWGIDPAFEALPPDPDAMFDRCEAALIIGDPALFLDAAARGLTKIDLGEAWTGFTGLPFVWAVWAGRPDVLSAEGVRVLQAAPARGVAAAARLAADWCGPERADAGARYLRENIKYGLGTRERAGLERYYELAAKHGLIERPHAVEFY